MTKYLFNVELTDTFRGEANYSWVRREEITVTVPEGATAAQEQTRIIRAAKKAVNRNGFRAKIGPMGLGYELRFSGRNEVMFVPFVQEIGEAFDLKEYHDSTLGNAKYCTLERGSCAGDENEADDLASCYALSSEQHIAATSSGWCDYMTATQYASECDVSRDDYPDIADWARAVRHAYAYNRAYYFLTEQD